MATASVTEVENQRAIIDRVLASSTFQKTPRLSKLLSYLCQQSFQTSGKTIKEYDIATDIFGRSADFDQTTDAIVRVEMHRLRKRLTDYYASEGTNDPIRICLRAGRYLPEFVKGISIAPEGVEELIADPRVDLPPPSLPIQHPPTPDGILGDPAEPEQGRWRQWIVPALLLVLATAAGLIWWTRSSPSVTPRIPPFPVSSDGAVSIQGDSVRLLCGSIDSTFHDRQERNWGRDAFYSGGSAVTFPLQPIGRTRDAGLFRSARTGEFSYKIPLKPGTYELRLYFVDTSYAPGTSMEGGEGNRTFSVALNGQSLLRELDISADAGPNTADIRVFKDIHPADDGFLHLAFSKVIGEPILNAIEITPGTPHRLQPIRITTQDRLIRDRNGIVWSPDNYFMQGKVVARAGTVTGPEDPQIYERERYGNFAYAIPVANGRYAVTLHLAETYWGPKLPGSGGKGSRIFNVFCNGEALLRNYDMFNEAGAGQEISKTFHGLESNGQGTLLLSFAPLRNYANVSAIEVIDESH